MPSDSRIGASSIGAVIDVLGNAVGLHGPNVKRTLFSIALRDSL